MESMESKHRNRLLEAINDDLNGEFDSAITKCRTVLKSISEEADFDSYAAVFVRYLTFLDHHGCKQAEMLSEAQAFLNKHARGDQASHSEVLWVRYQKGICLRRKGEYGEARAAFARLEEDSRREYQLAAAYQLAVIDMEVGLAGKPDSLASAESALEECRGEWRRIQSHREGFALLRLGKIAENRKVIGEALEYYAAAIEVFARHRCGRYLDNAWTAFKALLGRLPE